jgi:aminoglycoside 3-N-acetyltransferase I
MSTHFIIRRLGPSDVAHLRSLNLMFGESFHDPITYGAEPPADAYFANVLSKDHVVALASFAGKDLIGGLVAYELDKLERMRREFYIYDLAVASSHRRMGVATLLIERLREIAVKRGGWVIYVQADYGDDPAISLYEKLGHREEVLHFDIPIEPKP